MPAAAVTLYLPWQRRGFNKWGPREVTTFISGDTPDSIANLVMPPQRHYQSVYRTLPHALRARAPRMLRRLVLRCVVLCCVVWRPVSLFARNTYTRAIRPSLPEVFPGRWNNNASSRHGQFHTHKTGTMLYIYFRKEKKELLYSANEQGK